MYIHNLTVPAFDPLNTWPFFNWVITLILPLWPVNVTKHENFFD